MSLEYRLGPLSPKEIDIQQVLHSEDPFDVANHYVVPLGAKSLTKEDVLGTQTAPGMVDSEILWIMLPQSLNIASRYRGMGVTDERLLAICTSETVQYARDWSARTVDSSFAVYTNTRFYSQLASEIASENDMPADRIDTIVKYHKIRNLLDIDDSSELTFELVESTYYSLYPDETDNEQVREDLVHLHRLSNERSLGVNSIRINEVA